MMQKIGENLGNEAQNNNLIPKKTETKPKANCELIFSKFDQLDFGTKHRRTSLFSKKPNIKLDFAESLQLYQLVKIDDEDDDDKYEDEEANLSPIRDCSCDVFNSLHSSYSSDNNICRTNSASMYKKCPECSWCSNLFIYN